MQKLFYITAFFLTVAIFSSLLPYPVFSSYTNITENNAYQINNFNESELVLKDNQSPTILPLSQTEAAFLLDGEFEVFDIESGKSFYAVRIGGVHHADIEPADENSCQILKQICGYKPTWHRRSVLVRVSENAFIPASIAAYPHGYGSTLTTFNGHICMHFKNSKTDGTVREDAHHQKCVKKAAKKGKHFIKQNLLAL